MTYPAGGDRVGGQRRPGPPSPPRPDPVSWSGPRQWFEPDVITPPNGMQRLDTWPGHRPPRMRRPVAPRPATAGRSCRPVAGALHRQAAAPRPEPEAPREPEAPATSGPPAAVLVACRWWQVAAALGLVAMALPGALAGLQGDATAGGATVGSVLSELIALALTVAVVYRLRAGDDWARAMLSVIGGLLALLVAITAMIRFSTDTSTVAEFRTAATAVRLLQVSAVGMAVWSMFRPDADRWFVRCGRDG